MAALTAVPQASAASSELVVRVVKAAPCTSARTALFYYYYRHQSWQELRSTPSKLKLSVPRGCAYTRWKALRWKERAVEARTAYFRWLEEQRRFQLLDFRVTPGNRAWLRAVRETQRAYPGTESWLLSCSASEGGHGRWVPNSQGSGVGGWMQMYPSTFWRMFSAAKADVERMGFRVPASAASWYSPLGQALGSAWAILNGRRHEWVGYGC